MCPIVWCWEGMSAASPQAVPTGSSQAIKITQYFTLEGTLGTHIGAASSKGTLSSGEVVVVVSKLK